MSVGGTSDSDLVRSALVGDESAFEAIVRAHSDAVYGQALRFFGERTAAEDATQEVFIRVFRSLATFDGRSALSTWLFRVTRNVCLDIVRARRHLPLPVDPVDIPSRSVPDFSDALAATEAVEQAIRALPPEERDALGAVTLFGMSYEQAAEAFSVPVGTIKSRVFRARKTIGALLKATEAGA
ncbi:MAG: RNA polymerase sigma factor [Actinomycetia bacterium]|nr:RNA polymerase sigma factor [Actinomycetes bacterium]